MGIRGIFILHFMLLLMASTYFGNANGFVPVCIWQTNSPEEIFPALTVCNPETLKEILLQKQAQQRSESLIVFAEPTLSAEDLSNTDIFYGLAGLTENYNLTYLPTAVTPIEGCKLFAPEIQTVSINDLNDITFSKIGQLIISFDDARDNESRTEMLRRHVGIIPDLFEKFVRNEGNLIAVYTGWAPSRTTANDIPKGRQERSVEADPNVKGLIKELQHFLVYTNGSFEFTDEHQKHTEISVTAIEETDANTLTFKTSSDNIVLSLTYELDYWYISKVTYGNTVFPAKFYAPDGFSYSCSSNDTLKILRKEVYLKFPTFQLQYFKNGTTEEKKVFDDSYDCIGFTSAPIWSGLFVTLILVIIMSIGLTMIMDIKTMDRFDDPKGKTIIINASE